MREALRQRTVCLEGVLTCYPHETMEDIIDRIAKEQVGERPGSAPPARQHQPCLLPPPPTPVTLCPCPQVHRLVLVDENQYPRGIVSLSDILQALVLTPAGIDALNS